MTLSHIVGNAGWMALSLSACGAVYALLATRALGRFLKRPAPGASGQARVLILKPLHGDEPELAANLESFCRTDYPGPVRLVAGAKDTEDPALGVAREVQAAHPGRDIRIVADPRTHGTNRKIGNVINLAAAGEVASYGPGDVVIISDSDTRLPPDGLGKIVGALETPGVGLAYCLYRGTPAGNFWSRLAAMDVNARFAASVVVGQALGAHPVLGPTMAVRAEVLQQIGGIERLADFLADDFELGRAVRETGHAIACPSLVIDHLFPETRFTELFDHELRWARTVRLVQPAGYAGSVIIHFWPLALIGAALTGLAPAALWVLAGLTAFRLVQADAQTRLMGGERGLWPLVPLRDLVSLWVFLAALFGDKVVWRGARLQVRRDGAIATT